MEIPTSEILKDLNFQLLSDAKGVYGFGFRSNSQERHEALLKPAPDIILRADLLEPLTEGQHITFVFQPPHDINPFRWIKNKRTLESVFVDIQTAMLAQRNGLSVHCLSFLFDGTEPEDWETFPSEFEPYREEAFIQVEQVISSAYASCVPSAVWPVLKQLPIHWRYRSYTHMVDSPRFTQLLSEFPVLAFKLMSLVSSDDLPEGTRTRGKAMVEEGHKLGKIADVMKVADAMRSISIQDADDPVVTSDHFRNYNSHLHNYWDRNAENIGRWLWAIHYAHIKAGHEYAEWVACNYHERGAEFDVLKIGDWVRASLEGTSISPVTRPFEKTMSARTVERLSEEWHKNMEGAYNAILGIKRPGYWTGCPEADGCETEEEYTKVIREKIAAKTLPKAWVDDAEINGIAIKAATNELELIEASLYLKNCGGTYSDRIHKEESCIYTATRGSEFLAMIEVQRLHRGFHVTQCAGYLNQAVSAEVSEAVNAWERSFPKRPEPTWEEIYTSDNWELAIVPPEFNEWQIP